MLRVASQRIMQQDHGDVDADGEYKEVEVTVGEDTEDGFNTGEATIHLVSHTCTS